MEGEQEDREKKNYKQVKEGATASGGMCDVSDSEDEVIDVEEDYSGSEFQLSFGNLKSENNLHTYVRDDAVNVFRKWLEKELPFRTEKGPCFYDDDFIKWVAERNMVGMLNDYKKQLQGEDLGDSDVEAQMLSLEDALKSIISFHENRNRIHRENVEKQMKLIVEQLKREYMFKMEVFLKENEFVESEAFRKTHETEKAATLETFEEMEKESKDEKYLDRLKKELDAQYEKLEGRHQSALQKIRLDAETWIERFCDEYKCRLGELADKYESITELESKYKVDVPSVLARFHREGNMFPENSSMLAELDVKLEKDLQGVFDAVKLEQYEKRNLMNNCHSKYQSLMKEKMKDVVNENELEECHKLFLKEVTKLLNDTFPGQKCTEKLKKTIEDTFAELKEIFDMKRAEEVAQANVILHEACKYYHEEMDKYIKNDAFVTPMELEGIHRLACQVAVRKCAGATPLTEFQKRRLEQELKTLLRKYSTQNDMNLNSDLGNTPAIGIDLGTTYCCVGVYWKGEVIIIPNHEQDGSHTTPSYVLFNEDGTETVGHVAKENGYRNPENTLYDTKRIIGRKMGDKNLQNDIKLWPFAVVEDDAVPKVKVYDKLYHPEEVSAKLLIQMKEMTEKHLKLKSGTIKKAVITVPAYFNDGQRQATMDAGKLAGFDEMLEILNEPTSAAIAYTLERLDSAARKVLIFDLGGGTFDVAVLDVKPGEINVLGVGGDTHLGGVDFDKNLMEYCSNKFKSQYGIDLLQKKDSKKKQKKDDALKRLRRLQTHCERSKRNLSSARMCEVSVDAHVKGHDLLVKVTREKFEELNIQQFKKTIEIVDSVLKDVKVNKYQIDDIVLVGGSTRIPKVQELLSDYFGGKALTYSIKADEAVAYGAAIKAAILNGEQLKEKIDFTKIQDVTSMSLGVADWNKRMKKSQFSVIIPKNTKLPAKMEREYCTVDDEQTSVKVKVYEGEAFLAADNHKLGEFLLDGIPKAKAGKQVITESIRVNSMGIVHVEATCKSNGIKKGITIKSNKERMDQEAIKRLLEGYRAFINKESTPRSQSNQNAPVAGGSKGISNSGKRLRVVSSSSSVQSLSSSSEEEVTERGKKQKRTPKRKCRKNKKRKVYHDSDSDCQMLN